jgi:hypothetical protein
MGEPPRRIEAKSRACRGRDRSIDEIYGFGERARRLRIGKADAPRRPVRSRPERSYLSDVDERCRQPSPAQRIHDPIGGVPLGNAIERDRGTMPDKRHTLFAHAQAAAAHFRKRLGQPLGGRTVGIRLFRRKVFGVELPQRNAPSVRSENRSEALSSATMSGSGATRMPLRFKAQIADSAR